MELIIGCDHAAYEEKEELKTFLSELGHDVIDVGTHSNERCDYPVFAKSLVKELSNRKDSKGILICGSGIGVSMVANRYKGIRAALCRTPKEAELSRCHNDANVLCMGARINTVPELKIMVEHWLKTDFEGGRHSGRIALFNDLGANID